MKRINLIVITIIILVGCIFLYLDIKNMKKTKEPKKSKTDNFNINLIQKVNSDNKDNYLISPYSIEIALNMLKEGANNKTADEINKVLGNSKLELLSNDKVKIANGLFIKNKYKNNVKSSFLTNIQSDYNGELIYDDYETPKVINDWVKEKTDGMIPSLMDDISSDFVMGISNAIAIDVEWFSTFECTATRKQKFTKEDNSKIDVEMMNKTAESNYMAYFDNKKAKGVTIDYEDGTLEFVGILPKNNINDYIDNLEYDDLYNIKTHAASDKLHIILSLPRFKYDYSLDNFKNELISLGIKEAFNEKNTDFSNMIDDVPVYVSTAIHKSYIELSETGTKAAAATFFGMFETSAAPQEQKYKEYKIEFNKPFIYMIRDKSTKQILFFGVVKEPSIWNGSTCK